MQSIAPGANQIAHKRKNYCTIARDAAHFAIVASVPAKHPIYAKTVKHTLSGRFACGIFFLCGSPAKLRCAILRPGM
jgi:hypothetical protein